MTNRKQCPLRHMAPMATCCKEKCAWYLVYSKQCAIPLLASQMQRLTAEATYKADAKMVRK